MAAGPNIVTNTPLMQNSEYSDHYIIIGKAIDLANWKDITHMEYAINFAQFVITETPLSHTYFRNWNGSSAAMETDIIVEGFKNFEHLNNCEHCEHFIRYISFIGDGDSSVYSSLMH